MEILDAAIVEHQNNSPLGKLDMCYINFGFISSKQRSLSKT